MIFNSLLAKQATTTTKKANETTAPWVLPLTVASAATPYNHCRHLLFRRNSSLTSTGRTSLLENFTESFPIRELQSQSSGNLAIFHNDDVESTTATAASQDKEVLMRTSSHPASSGSKQTLISLTLDELNQRTES
jgi:hypothetical protein